MSYSIGQYEKTDVLFTSSDPKSNHERIHYHNISQFFIRIGIIIVYITSIGLLWRALNLCSYFIICNHLTYECINTKSSRLTARLIKYFCGHKSRLKIQD